MARLYLVRHATPRIEHTVPASHWRLSEQGRLDAEIFASDLEGIPATRIFTSPEPKTRETAEIIGHNLQLDVEIIDDLREHERETVRWMRADIWLPLIEKMFANPDAVVLGEESLTTARHRFSSSIRELLNKQGNEPVIAVTHGTVMSIYLASVWNLDPYWLWDTLAMPHLAIDDVPPRASDW